MCISQVPSITGVHFFRSDTLQFLLRSTLSSHISNLTDVMKENVIVLRILSM